MNADLVFRFVYEAVRAYGDRVLAGAEGLSDAGPEVVGYADLGAGGLAAA